MNTTFDHSYALETLEMVSPAIRAIAAQFGLEYDDLYQEAFLLACKRLKDLAQKEAPRAYLIGAIKGHVRTLAIKRPQELSLDKPVMEDDEGCEITYADCLESPVIVYDEQASVHVDERIQALYTALRKLPLEEQTYLREVYELNGYDPVPLYPYCLNNACRTRSAIGSRVFRALRRDNELRVAILEG